MEYQALQLTGLLKTAMREHDEAYHLLLLHQADLCRLSTDSNANPFPSLAALDEGMAEVEAKRGLPKKGRLVVTVLEAGPLLRTLMLGGMLPKLQGSEIPPVAIDLKPKREKDGGEGPPSPTSLWNSSSSADNRSYRGSKLQNNAE